MRIFSPGLNVARASWKGDLRASISVAFIAIPLGLGIAVASGAPPLSGIIPCVVGGLLLAWFSGGHLIVHNTSKMLIGVTAMALLTIADLGYTSVFPIFLSMVVVAGVIQFLLGMLKLGIIGELIPATVIKGLLASVGIIIIFKQIHVMLGADTDTHSTLALILETPDHLLHLNPFVAFIGLLSLAIMFVHPTIEVPVIRVIPSAVWVIIVSVVYSYALDMINGYSFHWLDIPFSYGPEHLVQLPDRLADSMLQPDFSMWNTGIFWAYALGIAVISSIEGIMLAKAADRLDPLKRKTNINREMSVFGLGTVVSGFIGGLPVIPSIVSTSVGINHNGRSPLMNAFHAVAILALVVALGSQLKHIPLAALAGILVHTGYKLANPKEMLRTYRIGWEQLIVFLTTLLVTVLGDLMLGILVGTLVTLAFHTFHLRSVSKLFTILFRPNVVVYEEDEGDKFIVSVKGYINFLNYIRLKREMDLIPTSADIIVDLSLAEFIDHTVMEHLAEIEEDQLRRGRNFEIVGLDAHSTAADHPLATRIRTDATTASSDTETLTSRQMKLRDFSIMKNGDFDHHFIRFPKELEGFQLFRFRTIDRNYNRLHIPLQNHAEVNVCDIDFHEGELQSRVNFSMTVLTLKLNMPVPPFSLVKERLFDRIAALAGYDDIDFKEFKEFSDQFQLRGVDEPAIREWFSTDVIKLLETERNYQLESDGNTIILWTRQRQMSESEVRDAIEFCSQLAQAKKINH